MPYISIRQNGQDLGWRELDGPVVIGRRKECDLCLMDMLLSRHHCRIESTPDGWVLIDLGSRNGTWHDETQIERMELTPGMRVRVGRTTLTFHPGTPPAEGRYVSRASIRPADPCEALAGTVMGMVVVDDAAPERPADPWAARRAARPRPTPRPAVCGESGIYPAIVDTSVPSHEPSSGACALLRESRLGDEMRVMPDMSEELAVREPLPPRPRPLPRPILLERRAAPEQEAGAADPDEVGRNDEPDVLARQRLRVGRRPWSGIFRFSHESVMLLLALALLAIFRLAVGTSNPRSAAGQIAAPPLDQSFDVGLMAATVADLPPLLVTTTPEPSSAAAPDALESADPSPGDAAGAEPLAQSARKLRQSLGWDSVSGLVKDYQREIRRFILESPAIGQPQAAAREP